MIKIAAAARLRATQEPAALKDLMKGPQVRVGEWSGSKVDGADLPFFRAIDATKKELGDFQTRTCRYAPLAFYWPSQALILPDDDTASHYYVFTKQGEDHA
jgi:hypothetical protein